MTKNASWHLTCSSTFASSSLQNQKVSGRRITTYPFAPSFHHLRDPPNDMSSTVVSFATCELRTNTNKQCQISSLMEKKASDGIHIDIRIAQQHPNTNHRTTKSNNLSCNMSNNLTLGWNAFYSVSMALNACWASVQWIASYIIGPIKFKRMSVTHRANKSNNLRAY